ncbi:hypothetical protein WN48_09714 [Eufriesea mexicana]|uniref:Uncharacterized protein n=1 Tax=Eufriesea mexicana TaxID=516756 RepID=A0A310SE20_9HYME|nr:hypothetical protein WN48_09714 [Eufriesea mexicana]
MDSGGFVSAVALDRYETIESEKYRQRKTAHVPRVSMLKTLDRVKGSQSRHMRDEICELQSSKDRRSSQSDFDLSSCNCWSDNSRSAAIRFEIERGQDLDEFDVLDADSDTTTEDFRRRVHFEMLKSQ